METLALWIFAIYGCLAIWIHIYKWFLRPHQPKPINYYVLTYNSQQDIEWVIRSYVNLAKLEGREFQIYVIDLGSEDDTLKIIKRLKSEGLHIKQISYSEFTHEHQPICYETLKDTPMIKVIDLRERCFYCEFKTT